MVHVIVCKRVNTVVWYSACCHLPRRFSVSCLSLSKGQEFSHGVFLQSHQIFLARLFCYRIPLGWIDRKLSSCATSRQCDAVSTAIFRGAIYLLMPQDPLTENNKRDLPLPSTVSHIDSDYFPSSNAKIPGVVVDSMATSGGPTTKSPPREALSSSPRHE